MSRRDRERRDEIEKANANARRTVNAALDWLANAREKFRQRRKKAREPKTPPYYLKD